MDAMTLFVGIIAFCMIALTVIAAIGLSFILKAVKSLDEKIATLNFELSQILPNIHRITQNIAEISGLFSIFSIFKKTK